MDPVRLTASVVFVVTAVVMGYGQSSPVNRPWPPGVQNVPNESPVLSPEEALRTFYMPPATGSRSSRASRSSRIPPPSTGTRLAASGSWR